MSAPHYRRIPKHGSRVLTSDQALAWNSGWSYTDLETICANLDRLAARSFDVPPSGGYVNCRNAAGRIVMSLYPGYLWFSNDTAPVAAGRRWLTLSTFRPHAGAAPRPQRNHDVCPVHHITLPASGICDDCE